MKDFGPESILKDRYPTALLNEPIVIIYAELVEILTGAEKDSNAAEDDTAGRTVYTTKIRKRKRKSTPEDSILSDDERQIKMRERIIATQGEMEDPDY